MKKNKMMRIASVLLVAVLMSTCAISGTFAKYVTGATGTDTARVAKWGFESNGQLAITDLFKTAYDKNVGGAVDVIAPGTTNYATFEFVYDEASAGNIAAPEVAYTFTVSVDGSICDSTIANNPNIQWKLDSNEWTDWDTLLNQIKALSGEADGSKDYTAGQLPTGFADSHTVQWQWIFETETDADTSNGNEKESQDKMDTEMGNADELANVQLVITITVTQID